MVFRCEWPFSAPLPVSKFSPFFRLVYPTEIFFEQNIYVTRAVLSLPTWKQINSIALGHKAKKIFFVIKSEGERMA